MYQNSVPVALGFVLEQALQVAKKTRIMEESMNPLRYALIIIR
jgi:hypothetical protein